MSRTPTPRVDPVLAGLIGAAVVVGGGLLAYGTSQPTDGQAAPAPVVQRDDALTARALAAVEGLASAGEDGAPSAPDAARRAAQASLRGRSVDPFRGGSGSAAAATATTTPGTTAPGTATPGATPSGTSAGSALDEARDAAAKAAAAGSAAGGAGGGAATGNGTGSGAAGGPGSGSAAGGGSGPASGSGSGSGPSGASGSGPATGGSVGGGSGAVGGGSAADAAEVARRLAAAERAEAARRLKLEAERLARAPARVSLRVATPNGKRARSRLPVGTLLPNRADAVLRVVRVDRANRIVTLRLRDGARLAGPQSTGTRCVLRGASTGGCRLVHVRAGKAAVVQAPDVAGAPGPITAVRVLSLWRGSTRVFGG